MVLIHKLVDWRMGYQAELVCVWKADGTGQNRFWRPKIDCVRFLCCLVIHDQNQLLSLELILGEVKKFFFLS